jgi:chromosome segregation ATPase
VSNPKLRFAEDIVRVLRMFPGIAAYAEEVGKTGSLEQAATEAEARLTAARKDLDDIDGIRTRELDKIKGEADALLAKAKDDATAEEQRAAAILVATAKQAEKIRADALAGIEAQRNEVQAELNRVTGALDNAKVALADVHSQINAAKDQQTQLTATILDGKTRLSEINAEIAAVRRRFG